MQTSTARDKTTFLGIIFAVNQAHILAHAVTVEVWRSECLLSDHPTRREDNKVSDGGTGRIRFDSQDGENRRIL